MLKYGLIFDDDPFIKYQAMKKFRLANGLVVLDGPLSMEDMKNEEVRNSIYSTYFSVTENKIIGEACHFGFVNHPMFEVIMLICTQKIKVLTVLSDCVFEGKEILSEYKRQPVDFLVFVSESSGPDMKIEETIELTQPYELFDINEDRIRETKGYDQKIVTSEDDVFQYHVVKTYDKVTVVEEKYNFVRLPLHRYIDMVNSDSDVGQSVIELEAVGGEFEDGRAFKMDTGNVCKHVAHVVKASSKRVRIKVSIRVFVSVNYKRIPHPDYKKKNKMLIRVVEAEFRRIVDKLKLLPRTRLVNRNIATIEEHVIGGKMPNPDMICQCYVMIDEIVCCPKGFDVQRERYQPCNRFLDWSSMVMKNFTMGKEVKKLSDLFEGYEFFFKYRVNCNNFPTGLGCSDAVEWFDPLGGINYLTYIQLMKDAQCQGSCSILPMVSF